MNFSQIPSDNLVPMFMTEFDNSNAVSGGAMPWKNLLVGQALSTKTGYTGKLVQITSDEQADVCYGAGSNLALMARAFRKNSKNSELWALDVGDSTGDKASGKIVVSVTDATNGLALGGVIRLMIGGQAVAVNVSAGNKAADIASAVVEAIGEIENLPVTASATDATVTITAKNGGSCGVANITYNHNQGEELPEGMSLAVTQMTGAGADVAYTASNLTNIIKGIWFNAIATGSAEKTNVAFVQDILDGRWDATVQQTGVLFVSLNGSNSTSDFKTYGNALNSQLVVVPAIPETPTPGFEVAAAVMGCVAPKALNDPAAPLSNYAVKGIVAPREEKREDLAGNNSLLKAGVALLVAGNDGSVNLKRIVTTYKTTANGAKDTSYQQVETVFTLSFIRWDWNNYMAGKYPHAKLADDGNDFGPGQVIMTPNLGKGELLGRYEYWMGKGLVQNYDDFKANLVVIRDEDDKTAMQFLIPAELVSQFFIGKSKILFK